MAVAGDGGAGLGLARLNDGGFGVLLPWICSHDWAVAASMLRRSLPFEHTFSHQCQSPAHQPDTPAVSLPQLTCAKGVACCSKDCQVCVASHPAWALSRPLAQETGKHDQVTRTSSEHSCSTCPGARSHADARSRLPVFSFASHARVAYVRCLSRSLDLTHCFLTPQTHSPQRQSSEPKP